MCLQWNTLCVKANTIFAWPCYAQKWNLGETGAAQLAASGGILRNALGE